MFVDAPAIVAILTGEADADALTDALELAQGAVTSPVALFEAVAGLCRKHHVSVAEAQADIRDFLALARIAVVPISPEDGDAALEAFARYGKGRGHPAQLNLGDCFAYGVAKSRDCALLFKGDDFARTDARAAIAAG